ncbi:uncharacterized protein PHALS_01839 [Plasmopara halstedii]|uniref:Uncharacterized protein n=1 Tax=Plasmopara halstedii TaxID=4781 RepID=A0A0P1AWC1_PLAHL|nr:uncharacterized protein PHALS_01839 [Plasmopara halstedii]CEG45550.1 hypothetical protein PHALS_01839 [Plasmopara halstedii]|eukprot:XP_024581919.1 hypothetical protein PHALS_01839 [Plasmopara halstedii]
MKTEITIVQTISKWKSADLKKILRESQAKRSHEFVAAAGDNIMEHPHTFSTRDVCER